MPAARRRQAYSSIARAGVAMRRASPISHSAMAPMCRGRPLGGRPLDHLSGDDGAALDDDRAAALCLLAHGFARPLQLDDNASQPPPGGSNRPHQSTPGTRLAKVSTPIRRAASRLVRRARRMMRPLASRVITAPAPSFGRNSPPIPPSVPFGQPGCSGVWHTAELVAT
jgi:hypothetical protein